MILISITSETPKKIQKKNQKNFKKNCLFKKIKKNQKSYNLNSIAIFNFIYHNKKKSKKII